MIMLFDCKSQRKIFIEDQASFTVQDTAIGTVQIPVASQYRHLGTITDVKHNFSAELNTRTLTLHATTKPFHKLVYIK